MQKLLLTFFFSASFSAWSQLHEFNCHSRLDNNRDNGFALKIHRLKKPKSQIYFFIYSTQGALAKNAPSEILERGRGEISGGLEFSLSEIQDKNIAHYLILTGNSSDIQKYRRIENAYKVSRLMTNTPHIYFDDPEGLQSTPLYHMDEIYIMEALNQSEAPKIFLKSQRTQKFEHALTCRYASP